MAIAIREIRNALISHAQTLGVFDTVGGSAPKVLPSSGVHLAFEYVGQVPARSGLNSTSAVLSFAGSVFAPMNQEPADDVENVVVEAVDALIRAYVGDFQLGGLVRMVDVRGAEARGGGGAGLSTKAGYARVGDADMRWVTVNVPLVVSDLYDEVP